jgi:small-conductance mechanosensitive channel
MTILKCLFLFLFLLTPSPSPAASPDSGAVVVVSSDALPAQPQPRPSGHNGSRQYEFTPDQVRKRAEEIQKLLDTLNATTSEAESISEDLFSRRVSLLNTLQNMYGRLGSQMDVLEKTKKDLEQTRAESETKLLVDAKPPYPLSVSDAIQDGYDDLKLRRNSLLAAASYIDNSLDSLRDQTQKAESALRDLQTSAPTTSAEAWEIARSKENVESMKLDMALRNTTRTIAKLRLEMVDTELEKRRSVLDKIRKQHAYSQEDLDRQIAALQTRVDEVKAALPKMLDERSKAERLLSKAQNDLAGAGGNERKKELATALVAEREAWFSYWQGLVDRAEQEALYLGLAQTIWRNRYDVVKGTLRSAEVWTIRGEAQARIKGFETQLVSVQNEQARTNAAIVATRKDMDRVSADRDLLVRYRSRLDALNQTAEDLVRFASRMTTVFTLDTRILAEIDETLNALRLAEHVTDLGKEKVMSFLNARLWSDDGYDITVLKLLVSIVLFLFGYAASRIIASGFRRFVLNRFNLDPTKSVMIQSVFFIFLIFVFLMVALDIINVPITAFAFIGGALALGIGVGAQNLFSNLISGFILMFSKPFRINDVIDVDGITATVEEIGARSTSIKTYDNFHVLVPNSYFLDHKVTNRTLTDQKVRLKVSVGVAYGSDVREVERLLILAASEHSRVLKSPEPFVVFGDFGPSALEFTLYFMIDMANASTLKVPSDIRFRLVSMFEKAGIVIAYPQMDVHLSGTAPVDVRLAKRHRKEGEQHDSDPSTGENPRDSDGSGEDQKSLRLP